MKTAVWTSEENERLKDLVEKDVSIIKVAAAFNRTIISVRIQARKIGTLFPPMRVFRKKWAEPSLR